MNRLTNLPPESLAEQLMPLPYIGGIVSFSDFNTVCDATNFSNRVVHFPFDDWNFSGPLGLEEESL